MSRYEKFSKAPHSLHVKRNNRHLSIVERHLAMLQLAEEEKRLMLENEQEVIREVMDFTHNPEVDEYGFPFQTRYQIADSVPDMYVPKENPDPAPQDQNAVKTVDQPADPPAGTA